LLFNRFMITSLQFRTASIVAPASAHALLTFLILPNKYVGTGGWRALTAPCRASVSPLEEHSMKVMQLAAPGGFEHLKLVDLPAPAAPAAGEIQVRIHASSLNYHDLGVVRRPARRPTAAFPWPTAPAWSRPWAQA
jgi:hypothetical protein